MKELGIPVAGVCPSYMGPTELPISYSPPQHKVHVYLSASKGREVEYGWGIVERIAKALPRHVFHLYGSDWETRHKNVIVHGRVPKEQMNEEIKNYHIGLRLNETDGFSEILGKAVLMGQYAVGRVEHPKIPSYENDMDLITMLHVLGKEDAPNLEAREWYVQNLNRYPWNV